ncbi:MAG: class I SAM-dependent methyltransferase [Candidatus Wildermuthbacteria bacterium]|nr:class I SAM-dependent methyltransferase [Candidatus Wildermuthbacteria bacterium]
MGNIEFFNQLAKSTNTYINTGRMSPFDFRVYERTFADIGRKVGLKPGDRVLDLGGGCGQIASYMAQKVKEVVLADGAEQALVVAKKNLSYLSNVTYQLVDITALPLPFENNSFDHVVCYSVVHYLRDYEEFERLVSDMLRIVKPGGKILIGEIPLADKAQAYFEERRKKPLLNFILNARYHSKKLLLKAMYRFGKVDEAQTTGLKYTRAIIRAILEKKQGIHFELLEQDKKLPFASSRQDLLIAKNA